jgi:PilZ domain-containing protein
LSEEGCFVEAATGLPQGRHVQISFPIADFIFRCNAVVRHRTGGGMGLQFMAMSSASRAGIRVLVTSMR